MDEIDRVSPTLRPTDQPVVMRQNWRDLLFLHWPIEPERIQRLLPPGLTVDTYDGNAYIGLVPFAMQDVRPVWSPSVPGLSSFLEVNVRTYVHYESANPGVWFFSLDAANPVAVEIARRHWGLPYFWARMSRSRLESGEIHYQSERRAGTGKIGCRITYRPVGNPAPAAAGSLLHFLAERYFLYAWDGRALSRGRVWHTPYPLQAANITNLEETLVSASGVLTPHAIVHSAAPLAHYASGVDVRIYPLKPVNFVSRRVR